MTDHPDVTVITVSYNTRELTLKALETLFTNAGDVAMKVVVWDNASHDGSAEAIAGAFPQVELIAHKDNIGFARANNAVAERAETEWLFLLNPDTETHPRAVEALLRFARENPQAGIVGGRTVYPGGALNPFSCWNTITLWSLVCFAFGLSWAFPNSRLFNPEGIGGWRRDSVREVDVVVGCMLFISTALWKRLGGFAHKYWMYGEEHDLCLRAAALGYRPAVTPDAEIMHIVGASTKLASDKVVKVWRARMSIVRDHWSPWKVPIGVGLMWLGGGLRTLMSPIAATVCGDPGIRSHWTAVWRARREWLAGY